MIPAGWDNEVENFRVRLNGGQWVRVVSWHSVGGALGAEHYRQLIDHFELLAAPPRKPVRVMYPEDIGL